MVLGIFKPTKTIHQSLTSAKDPRDRSTCYPRSIPYSLLLWRRQNKEAVIRSLGEIGSDQTNFVCYLVQCEATQVLERFLNHYLRLYRDAIEFQKPTKTGKGK